MATFDRSIHIERQPPTVFDVVGTHLFETQPKWEDGIVAIHPLTEGPMRVGSKAVMERLDLGVWRRKTRLLEPLAKVMLGPARRKTPADIKEYVEDNTSMPTADVRRGFGRLNRRGSAAATARGHARQSPAHAKPLSSR